MSATVIVLAEEALQPSDAEQIVAHHAQLGLEATYQVLVPADTDHHVLEEVMDALSLLDLREAWDAVHERSHDEQQARGEAAAALAGSLRELRALGAAAEGAVVQDDPLPALTQAVNNFSATGVVVVTLPHPVGDAFRRDWASRARQSLGVPVLHLYTGTSMIG